MPKGGDNDEVPLDLVTVLGQCGVQTLAPPLPQQTTLPTANLHAEIEVCNPENAWVLIDNLNDGPVTVTLRVRITRDDGFEIFKERPRTRVLYAPNTGLGRVVEVPLDRA